jgi:anti-sigma factor RsiW
MVTEYILDLLPAEQRRAVERHASDCPGCRALLVRARRREAEFSSAFRMTMAPPTGRLEALWPQVSLALEHQRARGSSWLPTDWGDQWRIAFAVLGVALAILMGAFAGARGIDSWLLSTYTPTLSATPTASLTPAVSHTPVLWTVTVSENEPVVIATPAPLEEVESPDPAPPPDPLILTPDDHQK